MEVLILNRKFSITFLVTVLTFGGVAPAYASSSTVDATPVTKPTITKTNHNLMNPSAVLGSIEFSVYADPGAQGTGSSGGDSSSTFGNHAFITIANNTSSNIIVGKLSQITPGTTVTMGTWGNKAEHTGLWYNLESNFVSQGAYANRVSLTTDITSSQLSSLSSLIANNDAWSYTNNCSSFAEKAWNSVSSTKIDAGLVDTPKNLASSITAIGWYNTGRIVPWDYSIYYAQGTGTPKYSTTWN